MAVPPLNPPFADTLIDTAISDCARYHFGGDQNQVLSSLRQGRCDVCNMFTNYLINKIGGYLGQMDKNVKAVLTFEPEPGILTPYPANELKHLDNQGINLIAWVDRKSAAMSALGASLESAVMEARKKIGCPNATPACYSLDLQLVDDRDVQESRNYGLAVKHPNLRSVQVWNREEQSTLNHENLHFVPNEFSSLDLDLAPEEALFDQAFTIENLPENERQSLLRRSQDIKTALIRRLISDQSAYIHIAKEWLTFSDLLEIYQRRIGNGKIGGKAAGLVLAARILKDTGDEVLLSNLRFPKSYYLGSDLIYIFTAMNGLMHWNNQKYKSEEEIINEYPIICEQFAAGRFPPEVLSRLKEILKEIGNLPFIVRSSSQLEDNFGTSFAGKYQSTFCPNQGTEDENLAALTNAIAGTYASTLNPDALLYRRSKGLQDYDERMAALIQVVQGNQFGQYYFPFAAGVAFSRNLYRWAPQIKLEDGYTRMVWGLGTHAVERGGRDYPRLVALSHPTLQPDDEPRSIRYYSQRFMDLIDLTNNQFISLPIRQVISTHYPELKYLVQLEEDGYLSTPRSRVIEEDLPRSVITFDELLRRTTFAANLTRVLKVLEDRYQVPIDIEYTLDLELTDTSHPIPRITLLQCRPQSQMRTILPDIQPAAIAREEIVFTSSFMVPSGYLNNVQFVVYIHPQEYFSLATNRERNEVGRIVSALNSRLSPKTFVCVGPGRWGSTNLDLGVFVNYADVYNAAALIELSGQSIGLEPEPSFGTHFFQDLMEAQIYPLAIHVDDPNSIFCLEFFEKTPNRLTNLVEINDPNLLNVIRLIEVNQYRPGYHLEIYLDGNHNQTTAYFVKNKTP